MSEQLKTLNLWLPAYLRQKPVPWPDGVKDILLCVCDHFEPLHHADKPEALRRMAQWNTEFPKNIAPFRDADGVRPRHTFFYPIEQYDRDILNEVRELVKVSGGEVELHLHHDRDTPENLRARLLEGKARFEEHGFLSLDAQGRSRYGFVHGDWALDNAHPDGLQCGVNNELAILNETGCYADFTLPSAPDPTQTRTVNRLYYALDQPQPKSHDHGVQVRVMNPVGPSPFRGDVARPRYGDLLIVQGPLGLNWERRKFGVLPRLENSDLTMVNPPRPDRLRLWLRQHIHVLGRPEWFFIKLHTHGAPPPSSGVFLGEPYRTFHQHLAEAYTEKHGWRLHYVTARELVNILHAAEDGHRGNPGQFRDYRYKLPAG